MLVVQHLEGTVNMNSSMNQKMHQQASQPLFQVDFHSFMERENMQSNFELATEFGLSLRDVKVLKHKLSRN
ncbi:hypothetical protein [Halalkalibacter urbisdiaboli]|uniref:hypothetical protein n=1 Tax=Halalkalibacter urbisdiaboli TaxID=1960589 RepID=UPI000B440FD5|nr:hypothetical protein [Halalkalibacter urbisdiaboli]